MRSVTPSASASTTTQRRRPLTAPSSEKKAAVTPVPPPDTHKLLVGWRTRVVDGVDQMVPPFKAPANYKDEDKIKAYVAERRDEFLAQAKDMPYTGTFAE